MNILMIDGLLIWIYIELKKSFLWMKLVLEILEYHGFFIEWPEVPSEEETIRPTHKLEIKYSEDGDSRSYKTFKI